MTNMGIIFYSKSTLFFLLSGFNIPDVLSNHLPFINSGTIHKYDKMGKVSIT